MQRKALSGLTELYFQASNICTQYAQEPSPTLCSADDNFQCEHTVRQQELRHAKNATRVTVHVLCPTALHNKITQHSLIYIYRSSH